MTLRAVRICAIGLLLVVSFVDRTASAASLTVGEFQWSDDGSGLGPVFQVRNFSLEPQFGAVPADFTGAAFESLTLSLDGGASLFTLDALEAGGVGSPGLWQVFADPGVTSARLLFTFLARDYDLTLGAGDLFAIDPGIPDAVAGTALLDYEVAASPPVPAPVPEPGSLMLLASGLAAAVRGRRHFRK